MKVLTKRITSFGNTCAWYSPHAHLKFNWPPNIYLLLLVFVKGISFNYLTKVLVICTCTWTLSLDLMPYFGYILFDQKCKFWQQKDTKTFCLLNPEFEISNSITFCFLFLKTGICVSKPIFLFLKPGICVSKPIFLLLKPGICDFKPLSSTVMHAEFEV